MDTLPAPTAADVPFDFKRHRSEAIEVYHKLRPLYKRYSDIIHAILRESLKKSQIKVASIENRAKTIDSFGTKASLPASTNPNLPKYPDPINEITDLAGIRIITFFPRAIDEVGEIITSEFEILEKSDKSDILKEEERFGYQSIHYLVKLKPNRIILPEYAQYDNLVAEIQVRTILQHAWDEIEHDIRYKSVEIIPTEIHRRFMALAGLIEIADREFQAIQDADNDLTQNARESVEEGRLENIEITPDALKAYLDKKLGSDGRVSDWSYDWQAKMLRKMGFSNFSQIDDCISGLDDDHISRTVWGYRQGQIQRFDAILLAAMGENYIKLHPFAGQEWFTKGRTNRLAQLHDAGIKIRDYSPPKN